MIPTALSEQLRRGLRDFLRFSFATTHVVRKAGAGAPLRQPGHPPEPVPSRFGCTATSAIRASSPRIFALSVVRDVMSNADKVFIGPYSQPQTVFFFFKGDKVVLTDLAGEFVSGWGNAAGKLGGIIATSPPNAAAKNFLLR